MSHNPQHAQAPFALGWGVVELAGPDATAFAQAQCMNDVAALSPGHWQWNGWLTPKGRVIALFVLLKFDDGRLWLLLPDAGAEDLAGRLRRFLFRSRTTIAVRGDLHASGGFAPPTQARDAAVAGDQAHGIELDLGADGGPRTVRIGGVGSKADGAAVARWNRYDLEHGLPRLAPGQQEQWTPQMLSLDRLRAYSVKKGCYPGQEIVARTHFLGQAKRGLALLAADQPLAAGMSLRSAGTAIGEVVCAAGDPAGWRALAVAPVDAASAQGHDWAADGVPVARLPLLRGLARPMDTSPT